MIVVLMMSHYVRIQQVFDEFIFGIGRTFISLVGFLVTVVTDIVLVYLDFLVSTLAEDFPI